MHFEYLDMYYKIILLLFFISSLVFSQAPQGINYQAVVRDADGLLYDNQELTVIFKLIVLETGNVTLGRDSCGSNK